MNDWITLFTRNDIEHLSVALGVFAVAFALLTGVRSIMVGRLEKYAP
jgi:hypothetical protein